ncbi:MAG: FMN-binding protein [Methylotenera sp.]
MMAHATVYKTIDQVKSSAFPDATKFIPSDISLSDAQAKAIEKQSGVRVRNKQQKVWLAMSQDKKIGWLIIDEVIGKHEFITYSTALNADGSVKLLEVMDYRETHGGQIRDPDWLKQFIGKVFGAKLKLDEDITNISGATLSCKHIADGVKRLLSTYDIVLKNQG